MKMTKPPHEIVACSNCRAALDVTGKPGENQENEMSYYPLPEPIGDNTQIAWGPVTQVYRVGEIAIVEYVPTIDETGRHHFGVYVDGKDCHQASLSLTGAMILALAIIHVGNPNDARYAAKFASKILDIPSDY